MDRKINLEKSFANDLEKILLHVPNDDSVTLDLSNLDFCPPYAICELYLLINQWRNDGAEITIIPPQNNDCLNYLRRVHFLGLLEENKLAVINSQVGHITESNKTDVLFELKRFQDSKSIQSDLLNKLWYILSTKGFNDDFCAHVTWVIGELCDNVFIHSRVPGKDPYGAFVCIQSYSATPCIRLVVGDLGKGIRASFNESDKYKDIIDDNIAILTAMKQGVSSWTHREGQRRGNGLTDVLGIALGNNGEIDIRSANGRIWLKDGKLNIGSNNGNLDGTLVGLKLFVREFHKTSREEIDNVLSNI